MHIYTPVDILHAVRHVRERGLHVLPLITTSEHSRTVCPLAAAVLTYDAASQWQEPGASLMWAIEDGWARVPEAFRQGFIDQVDGKRYDPDSGANGPYEEFLYALGDAVARAAHGWCA